MATTMANRSLKLTTPLGKDVLLIQHADCSERLSQPFELRLSLLSGKIDINPDDLLGQEITLSFKPEKSDSERHFHGVVAGFALTGFGDNHFEYSATVRPWYWLLSQTSDCRIHQGMSVPKIFEKVVKEYGFSDYRLDLTAEYQSWEYCVQYRETDFNFLSRLLEQEGIYYYFEHSEQSHVMVLVDDSGKHKPVKGYETVPYYPPDRPQTQRKRDHLVAWNFSKSVYSSVYATSDFDFTAPRKSLLGKATIARKHKYGSFEIFDYPAELQKMDSGESDRISKVRIEELQTPYFVARGHGDAVGLCTGCRFKLSDFPRNDLNQEYLVTGASYSLSSNAFDSRGGAGDAEFSISVDAIDARTQYRPPRITPKPSVQGTQTAMVVGKSGEEITTDEFGRVKVQFAWDRYSKRDESSSCWVRVAQIWAGEQWGGVHIPRIGQEVIVSFIEGDPDDPIITGRVYNGTSKPPYTLPDNATQSGIKSRSSKGGGADNFNELRFEDKKGSEEVFLQAEKDWNTTVKNNQGTTIGKDRSDQVGNNETTTVSKDRSDTVGGNETLSVSKDRSRTVGGNETVSISKKLAIDVGQEISITTGASKLVMKSTGEITIEGLQVTIKGNTKVQIESGVQVQIKGTQTSVKGTMLELSGDAMAKLKGGITMIG